MLFTEELIFIHIGKTGGMSCSDYLHRVLRGPIYASPLPDSYVQSPSVAAKVEPLDPIWRHCTLKEALRAIKELTGKEQGDFKKALMVIRHPYTLEYSLYKHFKKDKVREFHLKRDSSRTELSRLPFPEFIVEAGYHREHHPQEAFFLIDGVMPRFVELIRFEELAQGLAKAVEPFVEEGADCSFPHHNETRYSTDLESELTDEVKELIYQKHRYMFDSGLYQR